MLSLTLFVCLVLQLKRAIHEIIVKAFICTEMEVVPAIQKALGKRTMCAFELFGFDLMFDNKLNPSLVEVRQQQYQ